MVALGGGVAAEPVGGNPGRDGGGVAGLVTTQHSKRQSPHGGQPTELGDRRRLHNSTSGTAQDMAVPEVREPAAVIG
jgi:hypothetical protein